jgi:hypothetical protein
MRPLLAALLGLAACSPSPGPEPTPDDGRVELTVEVVDAGGGERVSGAFVIAFHRSDLELYEVYPAPDGLALVPCTPGPGLTLSAEARGHRRRYLHVGESIAHLPTDAPTRISLEPGIAREVLVVDAATDAPLPGATAHVEGDLLQPARADGVLRLHVIRWPERVRFEAEGYEPAEVDPSDWLELLERPTVALEPSR